MFIPILFNSCKNDAEENELSILLAYLSENNILTEPTSSGLYYIESGFSTPESINALKPVSGDTVVVVVKGYLLTSPENVFVEKTYLEPEKYVYKKDDVIKGWEEAIGYMRKGVYAKIIVPSNLAYGKDKVGLIPPYSTLIFEIRVLDIK